MNYLGAKLIAPFYFALFTGLQGIKNKGNSTLPGEQV